MPTRVEKISDTKYRMVDANTGKVVGHSHGENAGRKAHIFAFYRDRDVKPKKKE